MASHAAVNRHAPVTPAKSMNSSRPSSKLQDSPFSDYFTDDARSTTEYSVPSSETQQLLVRLSKLQSQLMRGEDGISERDTLHIVERKMSEIEVQLNALHSQTRMPPELEDSGLFMEEEEEEDPEFKEETPNGRPYASPMQVEGGVAELLTPPVTAENKQAEHDFLLLKAQQALESVSKAQEQLRQRHVELRELNDAHIYETEERDRQIEALKSENEALKSDLGFDHSELLFLNLQFKALEIDVGALNDEAASEESQETVTEASETKRDRILQEMEQWRSDWEDVDGRMKRRRTRYGVLSAKGKRDSNASAFGMGNDEEGDWRLDTVVREHGSVQSISMRRVNGQQPPSGLDGAADAVPEPKPARDIEASAEHNSGQQGIADSKATYTHTSTQTGSVPPSWLLSHEIDQDAAEEAFHEDDCAITTSSEDNDTSSTFSEDERDEVDDEEDTPTSSSVTSSSPNKTAWQDLWEGLASLAGVKEDPY